MPYKITIILLLVLRAVAQPILPEPIVLKPVLTWFTVVGTDSTGFTYAGKTTNSFLPCTVSWYDTGLPTITNWTVFITNRLNRVKQIELGLTNFISWPPYSALKTNVITFTSFLSLTNPSGNKFYSLMESEDLQTWHIVPNAMSVTQTNN